MGEREKEKENIITTEDDNYYSARDFLSQVEGASSKVTVITKESLYAAQRGDLKWVMGFLSLTEGHARTLLIHHRWDTDKLHNMLLKKGKYRVFAEAGIVDVEGKNIASFTSLSTITCNVCMENFSSNKVTAMDCGHYFCNNCWTEHFTVKINEGKSRRIRCMLHECNTVCDEAIIKNLVSAKDFDLAERFERNLLESYIEDNEKVKWCPRVPHCGNAIRVEDDECCEVKCLCGLQFCFKCLSEVHSPCSCLMWKLWTQQEESESNKWITKKTVPCPKCHKAVEKNGGCNLMVCICGQAYCWLCGEVTGRTHTWNNIEGHICKRHEDGYKTSEQVNQTHHRFVLYDNFFQANKVSFELEKKLEGDIKHKISLEESTLKDFSWVKYGLHRLLISRRVLTYSYPFAFYMFDDNLLNDKMTKVRKVNKELQFQVMQRRLQTIVKKLSNILKKLLLGLNDKVLLKMRNQVSKLTAKADSCCQKMYVFIENLLGALCMEKIHDIAPYQSTGGVERDSDRRRLTVSRILKKLLASGDCFSGINLHRIE